MTTFIADTAGLFLVGLFLVAFLGLRKEARKYMLVKTAHPVRADRIRTGDYIELRVDGWCRITRLLQDVERGEFVGTAQDKLGYDHGIVLRANDYYHIAREEMD